MIQNAATAVIVGAGAIIAFVAPAVIGAAIVDAIRVFVASML